jgi:hypothetical protein
MEEDKLLDNSKKTGEDKKKIINENAELKGEKGEIIQATKKESIDNDDQDDEQILSNTRVDITFSQMNESGMSVQSCQSMPFKEDKPVLDLPDFNPTKYESIVWKIFHSLSFFLFASILATSTWFYYNKIRNIYHISLTIANTFYVVSTVMEWNHFKKGCIGYSNLNSKIKKNIDETFRAKVLRSEFGIKYFITIIASITLISGNIYYFLSYGLEPRKASNINNIDSTFVDFNLCGMLILALSQIMKIEKMLTENKTNSVERDFSKTLVEILLFFGALFYGTSYMIQMFFLSLDKSPFDTFYLLIRAFGNVLFICSSLVLQYRYYLSNYNDLNVEEENSEFL